MFLQSDVPSELHVFPKPDVPLALCSLSPMFPQPSVPSALHVLPKPDVPLALCSLSQMSPSPLHVFPQPYVPLALCSLSPMFPSVLLVFPKPDVPLPLCSLSRRMRWLFVPAARCFHSSVFPQPFSSSACCSKHSLTTAMIEETFVLVA